MKNLFDFFAQPMVSESNMTTGRFLIIVLISAAFFIGTAIAAKRTISKLKTH